MAVRSMGEWLACIRPERRAGIMSAAGRATCNHWWAWRLLASGAKAEGRDFVELSTP